MPAIKDDLISFLDLAPTVLSTAGVEPPFHMQGRPLAGPFAAHTPTSDYVYAEGIVLTNSMIWSERFVVPDSSISVIIDLKNLMCSGWRMRM